MASGLEHDNTRSLKRIADAMEGIVKELSTLTDRIERVAAVQQATQEDTTRDLLLRIREVLDERNTSTIGQLVTIRGIVDEVLDPGQLA